MPTTSRRRRAARGALTRSKVVDAAEREVRSAGFEQMTIRNLAAKLEVAPMTLYRHVQDKDDLLDEVVDRMLARRWRPRRSQDDWIVWTAEAAERFRVFLINEPAALHVYLNHPVDSRTALVRMETMLGVLRNAGFDDDAARRAYAAVHTYTIGFAALEAARAKAKRDAESQRDGDVSVSNQLAGFTTARQFRAGLTYLLNGVAQER